MVKNLPANAGDTSSIPGEGNGNPLQYSCLDNPHAQRSLVSYIVHGVAKELDKASKQQQHSFNLQIMLIVQ